jgi:hypothetical protein
MTIGTSCPTDRKPRFGIAMLAVILTGATAAPLAAQIRWRSGASPHSGQTRAQVVETISALGTRTAGRHMVVQFSRRVTPADRAALHAAGLTLLSYLGDNAFFAAVDAGRLDVERIAERETLIDAQPPQVAWKQHPVLARRETPTWAVVPAPADSDIDESGAAPTWIGAYVIFHPDVPLAEGIAVAQQHGFAVRDELYTINGLVIEMPLAAVNDFCAEDVP